MLNLHRKNYRTLLLLGAIFFIFASTYAFACTLLGDGISAGGAGQAGVSHCSHFALQETDAAPELPADADNCCQFYPDILRSQNKSAPDSVFSQLKSDKADFCYALVPETFLFPFEQREADLYPRQTSSFYLSVHSTRRAGRSPPQPLFV